MHDIRTALITGANRGIGLAIAAGLAERGLAVVAGCRDPEHGRRAVAGLGGRVTPMALELDDRATLKRQVAAIVRAHGPIDVLVNNAGAMRSGSLLEVAQADFDEAMRVHCGAVFDLVRLIVPGMVERNYGRVVNVSSGWGAFAEGLAGPGAYAVSKAALNALTVSLARSVPGTVKVNAACPGWVRTRMGGLDAPRTAAEGGDTAIWLATLPADGPSGGFFRRRRAIEW